MDIRRKEAYGEFLALPVTAGSQGRETIIVTPKTLVGASIFELRLEVTHA
jgi:hypothetical protein